MSAAWRVSVSATPGSSTAPCGDVRACVTMRSSSGSSAMTSSSLAPGRRSAGRSPARCAMRMRRASSAGSVTVPACSARRLDDRAHIADVHALFEQQLEDFLQRGDGDHLGNHVFDQFRGQLGHVLDQLLVFDAAQQTWPRALASSVKDGWPRRSGNQRPYSRPFGPFALALLDPDRGQAERRVDALACRAAASSCRPG